MEVKFGSGNSGIATGILGVAFIVLGLCGVIAWSWWWVLAPFWIPLSVSLALLSIIVLAKVWS